MEGRLWLGGRETPQGLFAHPQEWVKALLQAQSKEADQQKRQLWWKAARQQAQFLPDQFEGTRVAVAGDLVKDTPLDYWSKLVLAVWDISDEQKPYTSIQQVVHQVSTDPEVQLIFADRELSDTESRAMSSGWVEV